MKRILVIYYSQSGQLKQIVDNFLTPFKNIEIEKLVIQPKVSFPFPWDTTSFFDVMPECVLEDPIAIHTPKFNYNSYDLVLFAYQPWYLSPSLPATAILKHKAFQKRLNNTPVITLIGSRNMWLNAQEAVKVLIHNAGGHLVGNIPLIDKTHNLISVITILHWLKTGNKTKKWGLFPLPGVAENDINETYKFGIKAYEAIQNNCFADLQKTIIDLNKIQINTSLLFIESRAKKIFNIWAITIKRRGTTPKKRKLWLSFFRYYLFFALFVVSPILLIIYTLTIRPLTQKRIKNKKKYFLNTLNYVKSIHN